MDDMRHICIQFLFVPVNALKCESMSAQSAQLSMISFVKSTSSTKSQKSTGKKRNVSASNPASGCLKKPKRSYDKYRCVCLICANDKNIKDKSIAILARGGNHFIDRHHKRNHPKLAMDDVKNQIVTMDHISVPRDIRLLNSKLMKAVTIEKTSSSTQSAKSDLISGVAGEATSVTTADDPERMPLSGELLCTFFI